ncbi:MAG: KH domain-containing protein [Candidatus Shapirobacteria bacterium]
MDNLLNFLLKALVKFPEEVKIEKKEAGAGSLLYLIHANMADRPIIIGKQGKNIKAIRELVRIIAIREHQRVDLQIVE